jgi:hypothetical protein
MMTLDELIEELKLKRLAARQDAPVRLVVRRGSMADQHDCIGVTMEDGLHGNIVLLFAGAEAAISVWPREPDVE